MGKTLKVGVVGVGGILRVHMPGWQETEHAEVIAACDINEEVAKNFAKEWDIPQSGVYTDFAEMVANPDIDVIDIATPNMFHAPMAIAALEAGKHVLCEKPLAPTVKEVHDMIAARDKSGKKLMTAQHFRFRGISKALKAELNSGNLGDVYHARSWMLRRAGLPVRPTFLYKNLSGGGATIDIGVHILDLTLWFMGNPKPVSVSGVARTEIANQPGSFSVWGNALIPSDMDSEEFAAGLVRFDNGATLFLEVSWMLHHFVPEGIEDMRLWLYGTKGGATWPENRIYTTNKETMQFYTTNLEHAPEPRRPHAQEVVEFAQSLADDAPVPVPPEDSLNVIGILSALYESQRTGSEVKLDL